MNQRVQEDILQELLLLLLNLFLIAWNIILYNNTLKQWQTYSKEALTWPSLKRYKVLGCIHLIGYIFSLKCEIRRIKSHYTSDTRIVTPTFLRFSKLLHPCNHVQNADNIWNVFPLWFCKTPDDDDAPRNSKFCTKTWITSFLQSMTKKDDNNELVCTIHWNETLTKHQNKGTHIREFIS